MLRFRYCACTLTRALPATVLVLLVFATAAQDVQATDPPANTGGKWTPEQILDHDPDWLRSLGLNLAPAELWNADGGGLLEAVVQVGGCSSGFVSSDGLLITNHHCAFSLLQEHSTAETDLVTNGFLARDISEELPGATTRASIPHRFVDVTDVVESAAAKAKNDYDRYEAIERKQKALVAQCEEQPFRRCRVAVYDDGATYRLVEALEFPDVRLVYAPPRAIGEFGGEIDNWMWPRHTGDFALLRVYATEGQEPGPVSDTNLPYHPSRYLRVAHRGVDRGDFVMVVGYPGTTYRSWIADEASERLELFFPERGALYRDWMGRMERASNSDEEARIALSSRIKSLANVEKNARGQIAAINRGRIIEKKRTEEAEVLAWASERKEHASAISAYEALAALVTEVRASWHRDFLLDQTGRGALPLSMAVTLARWAREREKPDLEREPAYQERNRSRLLAGLKRDQNQLHLPVEEELLADYLERIAALPVTQAVAAVKALLTKDSSPRETASMLLGRTKVVDPDTRELMFEESESDLRSRNDPLLDFAFELVEDIERVERDQKRRSGAISRLRPSWRKAVAAHAGRPIDTDANGTLRVSLAHVRGYEPRDAVSYSPQTTLGGAIEKHSGEEPFDIPEHILTAAKSRSTSRYVDRALGDIPIGFLATGDTTGGSSGSPVLNGDGELVGVNFDRVWENVANDFGYNPVIARNVSVDVRYLLWLLEEVEGEGADRLLDELGIAPDDGSSGEGSQ